MHKLENTAAAQLGDRARKAIRLPATRRLECVVDVSEEAKPEPEPQLTQQSRPEHTSDWTAKLDTELHPDSALAPRDNSVPVVAMDESGQPLDLSGVNSWSRRLAQVSTSELLQTIAVNAAAPFILCSEAPARVCFLILRAAIPETSRHECSMQCY